MAKLKAHGYKLFTYISVKRGALITVMSDGVEMIKYPGQGWKLKSRLRPEFTPEMVYQKRIDFYDALPKWRKVDWIPTMRELEQWVRDGVAETTLGDRTEPDGNSPETNQVSWLIALGMI